MGKNYRTQSQTAKRPRRPFEKERIDAELKLVGEYGLKNKREVWRIGHTLGHLRTVARQLLTLAPKHPKRVFEGEAMIRRLTRAGMLAEGESKLDYVLAMKKENVLARRLQTRVFQTGLAKSIHHARALIQGRHIRVGKRLVNTANFKVRGESEKHVEFSSRSPFGGGRPGHIKRKNMRNKAAKSAENEPEEEDM